MFFFGWHSYGGFSAESAADLGCIGGFIGPCSRVRIQSEQRCRCRPLDGSRVWQRLGAEFFGLTPAADCVESGEHPAPFALLGIGGTYGMIAQLLDDASATFVFGWSPMIRAAMWRPRRKSRTV